ncbi:SH3 domain-binding protein 5-like isoform X1 [Periplaneta americana]|uniref:SH3 domain-binding protein 5-like isoform X1 n=1 Tax=Periplaneta americana TaxID=6978 RepID=UPI0037E81442
MATKTQCSVSSDVSDIDKCNDEVDPRVQIELERLNTATDDINKLEVDLDESRAAFRQLLCESTVRIDGLAKKLGACVDRARPYYEARMKAKEALQETQQAAVRFERANSAHAAAKEMVYLAEEGLSTEGRTFDHAWQEMLNHATMRVNESERERTLSELEHRRTSQSYHRAEMRVQQLQKELKRAIAKSSLNARRSLLQINSLAYQHQLQLLPYFEMKAQFNQLLEDQKRRVKGLEQQVGHAKMSYAEALRNLEQISDEIHRTRKYEGEIASGGDPLGARGAGVGAESPLPLTVSSPEPPSRKVSPPGLSSSSLPDTDVWSDSTGTGPPDSDSGEEFLRLPEKLGPDASPVVSKADKDTTASQMSEYLGLSSLSGGSGVERQMAELAVQSVSVSPRHGKVMETSFVDQQEQQMGDGSEGEDRNSSAESPLLPRDDSNDQIWTEISLVDSPEETSQTFAKMGAVASRMSDRDYIQYAPLTDQTTPPPTGKTELSGLTSVLKNPFLPAASFPERTFQQLSPKLLKKSETETQESAPRPKLDSSLSGWISRSTASAEVGGQNSLNRRQSLDTLLWGGPTTERVKELLSHGMMMLNISSLTERRASEPRAVPDQIAPESRSTGLTKKVPSPLEKSLTYLNAEDDSTSDSESLASVEMLTDEQISSLMLDQEIQDACEEVLGTPISEISPLIQDLQQRVQE